MRAFLNAKGTTSAQALAILVKARERVAYGWPGVEMALAAMPAQTVGAALAAARTAQREPSDAAPWALALAEALQRVEAARAMWSNAPATMPPATSEMAPCARELRLYLAPANGAEDRRLAWEDAGGISRGQAVCVLHLAVMLAQWDEQQARVNLRAEEERAELERARQQRAQVAARAIWGQPERKPSREPEAPSEFRSLRDLAHVANAFDQWEDES